MLIAGWDRLVARRSRRPARTVPSSTSG